MLTQCMIRTAKVVGIVLCILTCAPSFSQAQIQQQAADALRQHPLVQARQAAILDARLEGEALVIDLSREILLNGVYDAETFDSLAQSLEQQLGISRQYMLTFLVEGKTLNHWGMPVPGREVFGTAPASSVRQSDVGPLSGKKIALNPGHGWYYTGSAWAWQRGWWNGIIEDLVNAEIQMYVAQNLSNLGATVIYLREPNKNAGNGTSGLSRWQEAARHYLEYVGAPAWVWNNGASGNLNKDIMARPYGANYYGADILVSVHNNGGGGTGTETWYDTTGDYHAVAAALSLAQNIHNSIIATIRANYNSGWGNRGVKASAGGYGENHYAQMPAALVELAFMDTTSPDNDALHDERFKQLAAQGIVEGIADYFSVSLNALCGDLGGRTLAPGAYTVTCDIYVNAGQTLHIKPGVTLDYKGHSFTVNGQLIWGP